MIARLTERLASWETFLAVMALGLLAYAIVAVPNFTSAFNLSQAAAGVSEKALLAFRGEGPGDDLSALILDARVVRHQVSASGPA